MGEGVPGVDYAHKADFHWTSMIRLPEFVTDKVFAWAKASFAAKHPESDVNRAYLFDFDEGVVAQVMHKGPYDDEPATVAILDDYARSQGYELDLSDARRHHEIYISDPRRAKPEGGLTFSELLEALTGRTILAGFLPCARMRPASS